MDLSKAFDLVEWTQLFTILKGKNVAPVFLRIMLYVYSNQSCDVRWGSSHSAKFPVQNGVRQGAVSSPLLFSVYIDGLIKELRASGLGCRIDNFFYGCLGYADDLLLLSASRSGLQSMVKICEKFAQAKGLVFSTNEVAAKSKTKCILFGKVNAAQVDQVVLNGNPLPWVSELKHLGHILQSDNTMRSDILVKRRTFIGTVNAMVQEFHFTKPDVLMKLVNLYASSFYGSNLWDLYSNQVDKIFKTWNVTVRNIFGLPWRTHRYWIETLSGCLHPKTFLSSRYVKFVHSLLKGEKSSVRFLASICIDDLRTVMGRTLSNLANETSVAVELLTPNIIKKSLRYCNIPEDEKWRIPVLKELLMVNDDQLKTECLTRGEIADIINYLAQD